VIEPTALLASAEELRENNYILLQDRDKHAKEIEGYAATNGTIGPTDGLNVYVNMYPQPKGEQILSIDCEMVNLGRCEKIVLTRSLVSHGQRTRAHACVGRQRPDAGALRLVCAPGRADH